MTALGPRSRRVSELRRLVRRRSRRDAAIVLEGPRAVSEAVAAGITPTVLAVAESQAGARKVRELLSGLSRSVEVLVLSQAAFDSVAPATSPQPVLALVDKPRAALPESLACDDLVLVLVGVSDPGNTGTIIRTAEACAARCVVVSGGADPWAPKAVRASAGSVLRVPIVEASDVRAALATLRSAGAAVVAADAHTGEPHRSGVLAAGRGPVAIVLGSESHGLDRSLHAEMDRRVHIAMPGGAESLNVAMAATLLAFEHRREPNPDPL